MSVKERTNEQWLAALHGPERDRALAELRFILLRGLRAALRRRMSGIEPSVEDFAQEALIKILDNLDTFRGECRFTIWAQKIAVRVAFAEIRRLRWRDVSLDDVIQHREPSDAFEDPERESTCAIMMATCRRFIEEELSEKQRVALLTAMNGMPMEEVARRMGTNRNALYKVLHDARKGLNRRMMAEMLAPRDVLAAFAEG